jgi:hypothetical protein
MLIIKYTRDGGEHLDPTFFSASCRADAEARARDLGGWVEESDLAPSDLMRAAESGPGPVTRTGQRDPRE